MVYKMEQLVGLIKQQQRRLDNHSSWVIRLETMLEIALNRTAKKTPRHGGKS